MHFKTSARPLQDEFNVDYDLIGIIQSTILSKCLQANKCKRQLQDIYDVGSDKSEAFCPALC